MPTLQCGELFGLALRAFRHSLIATWLEGAADGLKREIGRRARDTSQRELAEMIASRTRLQQSSGVRVKRIRIHVGGTARLNDASRIHHLRAASDSLHDVGIVADEQQRGP